MLMLALALLVVGGSAAAAEPSLEFQSGSPTASQIDAYLRQKSSPLLGTGEVLYELAKQYSVDPRLIVAISGAETTFGLHTCADHNSWNWFYRGSCPPSVFESYAEGLEHVTKFMRRSYLNKGYTTIPLIETKYCAAGCENWVALTERFRDEMPASGAAEPHSSPKVPAPAPPASQPAKSPGESGRSGRIFGVPIWAAAFVLAIVVAGFMRRVFRTR